MPLAWLQPLNSGGIGKVVASNSSNFKEGDIVSGMLEWANYTVVPEGKGLTKVDNSAGSPLSYYLGVLGEPSYIARSLPMPHYESLLHTAVASTAMLTISGGKANC